MHQDDTAQTETKYSKTVDILWGIVHKCTVLPERKELNA